MTYVKSIWHKISCSVARQFVVVGLLVLGLGMIAADTSFDLSFVAQDVYLIPDDFENDNSQDKTLHGFFRAMPGTTKVFSEHSTISNTVVSNLRPLNSRLRGPPLNSLL